LHGGEDREDFFIRNHLFIKTPKYVQPLYLEHKEGNRIMFRPRRYTQKPNEAVVKTLVCQSIKKNIKCKFGEDKCTFAHKYTDLKLSPCKLRFCTRYKGDEPCPYIHTGETILEFNSRNQMHRYFPTEVNPPLPSTPPLPPTPPPSPYIPPRIENPLYKTRLCANIHNCRYGNRCNFAHSLQELRK